MTNLPNQPVLLSFVTFCH